MRERGLIYLTWLVAAAGVLASAAPARAFYWYTPPGKTLINPPDLETPGTPPTPPTTTGIPPPDTPPLVVTPPTPDWPNEVCPEPATLLGALAGFGAVAAARAFRRKRM